MFLKKIGCQYFMAYGEWAELEFNKDQKVVSIIGSWESEPERSNRSGKSALVEMLTYGLYGKTRAKREIDLINNNFVNEDMIVELTFQLDNGSEIQVKRGRTSSNGIILDLTGFEGADKKVVQEEINNIIGMNYDDFIAISFFKQGDIHTFMEAGPTGQSQYISRWLEKEYWKEYESASKEKQSIIDTKIIKNQVIAEDKPSIDSDKEIKANIILLDNNKKSLNEVLATLENQLEVIKGQLKKANEKTKTEQNINKLNIEIKQLDDEIDEANDEVAHLEHKIPKAIKDDKKREGFEKYSEQKENLSKELKDQKKIIKDIDKQIIGIEMKIYNNKDKIKKFEKFNNICPVTNTECSSIDNIKNESELCKEMNVDLQYGIEQLELSTEKQEKILEGIQEKYDKVYAIVSEIELIEDNDTEVDIRNKIKKFKEKAKSKEKAVLEKRNELGQNQDYLEELNDIDIDSIKREKSLLESKILDNKTQIDDIISNIAKHKAELDQLKERRKKAIEAEKEIKLLKEEMNVYKYCAFMFGKYGIPSSQVEAAFEEVEDETNIILNKLGMGLSVEFRNIKELQSWEDHCLICGASFPKGYRKIECPECDEKRQKKQKNELSIKILEGDKEQDFNLDSGGGKVLISLAIRLAFVRLLQRRSGVNLKLIVLDEIFGMLDDINRSNVLKLIVETLIAELGFDQIFVISHESEVRDVIPNVIKVKKFSDHSEFNWD